jgi:hypothetical protein
MLLLRFLFAALLIAGITGDAGAQPVPAPAPFQTVNGDAWITGNAQYEGAWHLRSPARPAFGLQLGERNDIPFETGTAGATFWVRNGGNGCSVAITAFGTPCGWQLALAITQFRSVVVGGNGIEIDGLSLQRPYGRLVNASDGKERRIGISANIYADWSGSDLPAQPRWFAGFDISHDRFTIARGMTSALTELTTVERDGTLAAAAIRTTRLTQDAPGRFATRIALHDGQAVFAFPHPYQSVPVCIASTEGNAGVRVKPSTGACEIVSSDRNDAAFVDVSVTGNPR